MPLTGRQRFDGTPVPGFAFGMSLIDNRADTQRDYLFEIAPRHDGRLELVIDVYTAFYFDAKDSPFDVDLWEDLKHRYTAPGTREGFYALAQAARTLLSGDTVDIDGEGVRCIAGAMTAAAETECCT